MVKDESKPKPKKNDAESSCGPMEKFHREGGEPRKIVELERLFGVGWYSRYGRRPVVDSIFGTDNKK